LILEREVFKLNDIYKVRNNIMHGNSLRISVLWSDHKEALQDPHIMRNLIPRIVGLDIIDINRNEGHKKARLS
jgi:hypothetical protein